jgi:hypothetical protein
MENILPLVLISKKRITSARSCELRFERRPTTQLLSNVMKIEMWASPFEAIKNERKLMQNTNLLLTCSKVHSI